MRCICGNPKADVTANYYIQAMWSCINIVGGCSLYSTPTFVAKHIFRLIKGNITYTQHNRVIFISLSSLMTLKTNENLTEKVVSNIFPSQGFLIRYSQGLWVAGRIRKYWLGKMPTDIYVYANFVPKPLEKNLEKFQRKQTNLHWMLPSILKLRFGHGSMQHNFFPFVLFLLIVCFCL